VGARSSPQSLAVASGEPSTTIDDDLAAFIGEQRSFFLATSNAEGQAYIQHRAGPPRQGNLVDNPKVHLFLIDYGYRRRVKVWGEARVVEGDRSLLDELTPRDYDARPEQAFVIHVTAWDANCPQHIPQRLEADDVAKALAERDRKIAELERQIAVMKGAGR
jgi:uncharacterized protein